MESEVQRKLFSNRIIVKVCRLLPSAVLLRKFTTNYLRSRNGRGRRLRHLGKWNNGKDEGGRRDPTISSFPSLLKLPLTALVVYSNSWRLTSRTCTQDIFKWDSAKSVVAVCCCVLGRPWLKCVNFTSLCDGFLCYSASLVNIKRKLRVNWGPISFGGLYSFRQQ